MGIAQSTPLASELFSFFFFEKQNSKTISEHYKTILEFLKISRPDLEVKFVVGNSNPNFIKIDHSLWDSSGDFEIFSKTDALGRMLCPQQGVNKSKKFLILVRADETGETFFHEYLHFLQAKRDSKVCEIYKDLDVSSNPTTQIKNSLLEYEVHRLVLANAESLSLDLTAHASVLEKLIRYQKEAAGKTKEVDNLYKWDPLEPKDLAKNIETIVQNFTRNSHQLKHYEPQIENLGMDFSESEARIQNGIALLSDKPKFKDSICVTNPENWNPDVLLQALAAWNQAARLVGAKTDLLKIDCDSKPEISLKTDANSGSLGDGIIKLGAVFKTQNSNKQILLIRKLEFDSQENLIRALVHKEKLKKPSQTSVLNQFLVKKLKATKLNFLMHELGHALGLAHNFNSSENSIMNYSNQTELSEYDLDALRFLQIGPQAVQKKWSPKITN